MRYNLWLYVVFKLDGNVLPTHEEDIQCESKKVAPLKLFAIFLLRLSIFPWNFANLLPV